MKIWKVPILAFTTLTTGATVADEMPLWNYSLADERPSESCEFIIDEFALGKTQVYHGVIESFLRFQLVGNVEIGEIMGAGACYLRTPIRDEKAQQPEEGTAYVPETAGNVLRILLPYSSDGYLTKVEWEYSQLAFFLDYRLEDQSVVRYWMTNSHQDFTEHGLIDHQLLSESVWENGYEIQFVDFSSPIFIPYRLCTVMK